MTGTTSLRVRYAETDQMGVVYYAHYFVWFEVARAELLREHGWSYRDMKNRRHPAVMKRTGVRPSGALRDGDVEATGRMTLPSY